MSEQGHTDVRWISLPHILQGNSPGTVLMGDRRHSSTEVATGTLAIIIRSGGVTQLSLFMLRETIHTTDFGFIPLC